MSANSEKPRSIKPLIWLLLLSIAPVAAAFIVYFTPALQPSGATNYGMLVEPQRPMPDAQQLTVTTLDGQPFNLSDLKGQWLVVTADEAACPESCAKKLFVLRNTHAMTGKNVKRINRVWFITDDAEVPEKVMSAYEGTIMLRADPTQLSTFLAGKTLDGEHLDELLEPIWIIDPLGNLMMQYPLEPDPLKMRKDLGRLLHNSRIG
jgi:peroxiredoxin